MIKIASLLTISAIIFAPAPEAIARSTGWINGYEWGRIASTLEKSGEMPVSVVCKDSDSKGLTNRSGIAKIEIKRNPGKITWYWAVGARVNQVKGVLERRGFKLVSYSEYRRASGLKIPCAIWHRK